jgi:hypothetical protein
VGRHPARVPVDRGDEWLFQSAEEALMEHARRDLLLAAAAAVVLVIIVVFFLPGPW